LKKVKTLEELVKKYLDGKPTLGTPDTYDTFKYKNDLLGAKSYSDAAAKLYASSKRNFSSFGANNRKINNNGLQNSGYSAYIDSLAKNSLKSDLNSIKSDYLSSATKSRQSYQNYLEKYKDKLERTKRSVMSHLVSNDVVDLDTAVAYGISAGLSKEDASLVGQSAYEVTKQKVFNKLIDKAVTLGLDKNGAKELAIRMGVSEEDASSFADEIDEMMKYYRSLSDGYLEYLEQRSN
jgi:hypothetical protein